MNRNSPDKIVSFEVVPQSVVSYTTEDGSKQFSVSKEHLYALDSFGALWVRHPDEAAKGWIRMNIQSND